MHHSSGSKQYGVENDGRTDHLGAPSVSVSRPAPAAIEVQEAAVQYEHAGAAADCCLGRCCACRVDGWQKGEVSQFGKANSWASVLHFISEYSADSLLQEHSILAPVPRAVTLTEA